MSKSVLHTSNSRGTSNLGWLHSRHTFSFGEYYAEDRMHFGALRVLNDDLVAPAKGFGTHAHSNIEIITIPLEGDLEHTDNMNNVYTISNGDVQVMSAGTGIYHSEYNKNRDRAARFLQIWVFPSTQNVVPRYQQIKLDAKQRVNKLQLILSPQPTDNAVWIHQEAWFYVSTLMADQRIQFALNDPRRNGVYVFLIKGQLDVNGHSLNQRDGLGLWEIESVDIKSSADSEFLLMEVPMNV